MATLVKQGYGYNDKNCQLHTDTDIWCEPCSRNPQGIVCNLLLVSVDLRLLSGTIYFLWASLIILKEDWLCSIQPVYSNYTLNRELFNPNQTNSLGFPIWFILDTSLYSDFPTIYAAPPPYPLPIPSLSPSLSPCCPKSNPVVLLNRPIHTANYTLDTSPPHSLLRSRTAIKLTMSIFNINM